MISVTATFFSLLARSGYYREGYKIARHKIGSTDDSVNWKEYWKKNHRQKQNIPLELYRCPSCLMLKDDIVGGHIVVDDKTYIIPVCRECNSKYKGQNAREFAFYVKEEDMVRAPED